MRPCRGTSTRFQFCPRDFPIFGKFPNVCGIAPAVTNPNAARDSGVAMARLKTRRVIKNAASKLNNVVNQDSGQSSSAASFALGVNTYTTRRGEISLCAASRAGGVGKIFGSGRAKRCFNSGCVCGDKDTDTPNNFSGNSVDSSILTAYKSLATESISTHVNSIETTSGILETNFKFSVTPGATDNSSQSCGKGVRYTINAGFGPGTKRGIPINMCNDTGTDQAGKLGGGQGYGDSTGGF